MQNRRISIATVAIHLLISQSQGVKLNDSFWDSMGWYVRTPTKTQGLVEPQSKPLPDYWTYRAQKEQKPQPVRKEITDFIPWLFEKPEEIEVAPRPPTPRPPAPAPVDKRFNGFNYEFDDNLYDDTITPVDLDFTPDNSADFKPFLPDKDFKIVDQPTGLRL